MKYYIKGNNMNAIYMLDGNNIKTIGGVTIARTDKSTIIPSIKDVNGNILVRILSNSIGVSIQNVNGVVLARIDGNNVKDINGKILIAVDDIKKYFKNSIEKSYLVAFWVAIIKN